MIPVQVLVAKTIHYQANLNTTATVGVAALQTKRKKKKRKRNLLALTKIQREVVAQTRQRRKTVPVIVIVVIKREERRHHRPPSATHPLPSPRELEATPLPRPLVDQVQANTNQAALPPELDLAPVRRHLPNHQNLPPVNPLLVQKVLHHHQVVLEKDLTVLQHRQGPKPIRDHPVLCLHLRTNTAGIAHDRAVAAHRGKNLVKGGHLQLRNHLLQGTAILSMLLYFETLHFHLNFLTST